MKQTRLFFVLTILIWVAFIGTCIAEDWIKPGEERFRLNAGAFLASFDTSLRVDNKGFGDGTEINLEDDLNFDDSTFTYLLDGYWRFAKRHRLYAGYFVFNRDASTRLNKEIVIDGDIYPVGAGVNSEFDFKIVPIAYGYSFVNNEKHEFTGIIGLHWYNASFGINAYAAAGSEPITGGSSASANVPLPMLGFSYEYRFSDRWTAGAMAQAFYLDSSGSSFDFKGGLLNLAVKTEYWLFKNIGIGAAVNYFNLNVDVEDNDWKGRLDYQYFGPQLYVTVRF